METLLQRGQALLGESKYVIRGHCLVHEVLALRPSHASPVLWVFPGSYLTPGSRLPATVLCTINKPLSVGVTRDHSLRSWDWKRGRENILPTAISYETKVYPRLDFDHPRAHNKGRAAKYINYSVFFF